MKRTAPIQSTKAIAKQKTDLAVEAIKQMSVAMSDSAVSKDVVEQMLVQVNGKGRPTKYNAGMCQKVIKIMAKGKSRGNAATLMGVTEATFYGWMKQFPDFLKAVNIGDQLSELWWMTMGQLNILNKEFNSTLYMMQMQNRFGWSRRLEGRIDINQSTEHTETQIIEIRGESEFAEIAKILYESGAIKSDSEIIIEPQTH